MNPRLSQSVAYPLYELVTGRRVLSKLRQFERTQWLSRSEIEALQSRRLRRLLVHAYERVPFYRARIDALGLRPEQLVDPEAFRQLPLLTKDDILSHRDEMIAVDYPASELKLNATGGSTGHALSFYNDQTSLDYRSAVTIRGDRWAGLDIGTPHARLWGAPLELEAQEAVANRLSNWILNRMWLDCFRLSAEILAGYVERIRRSRVKVLVGYATALGTMAQFLEANGIGDIHLRSVISSAETLFDDQRHRIESAFDCKVHNRYGCREAGNIAVECEEGGMHINADRVYVEILRDGKPAQPDEMGEIVVTPLHTYGMPLIRYRIGDVGIASSHRTCSCGRGLPLIEAVVGRTSDVLVNAGGELFHGEYFTHLFYNRPGIRQFQVFQHDPEHLVFKIVPGDDFDPQVLKVLERRVTGFVGPMEVEWQLVEEIPPLASGKRSFTISDVPIDAFSLAAR